MNLSKKKSIVSYQDAKLLKVHELIKDFRNKNLIYSREILNPKVMKLVIAGFKKGIKKGIFSKEILNFIEWRF